MAGTLRDEVFKKRFSFLFDEQLPLEKAELKKAAKVRSLPRTVHTVLPGCQKLCVTPGTACLGTQFFEACMLPAQLNGLELPKGVPEQLSDSQITDLLRSPLQKTKSQARKKELQREVTRIEQQIWSVKDQQRKQEAEVAAKVSSCPLTGDCYSLLLAGSPDKLNLELSLSGPCRQRRRRLSRLARSPSSRRRVRRSGRS